MAKLPGVGMQAGGNEVDGATIHEALASEIGVPPELVALTFAVLGCVEDAEVVRKLPL